MKTPPSLRASDGQWYCEVYRDRQWEVQTTRSPIGAILIASLPVGTEAHVHARLLAAAPQLYEALDEVVAEHDQTDHCDTGAMRLARAALAKATGQP